MARRRWKYPVSVDRADGFRTYLELYDCQSEAEARGKAALIVPGALFVFVGPKVIA